MELGRLDGLSSTASSVPGQLPEPNQTMDQLRAVFKAHGLNMSDLVALSAAHSVGLAHCSKFSDRLYNHRPGQPTDPTLSPRYARFLEGRCPDGGPDNLVLLDQASPAELDNQYYRNLQDGGGLLGSDELLYTDNRTRPMVDAGQQHRRLLQGLRRRHRQARPRRGQVRQARQHPQAVRRVQLKEKTGVS